MLWLPLVALTADTPADTNPVNTLISSAFTAILGYGLLGILVLAMGWLFWKGWRLVSPAREKEIRNEGRADLLRQIARLESESERLQADVKMVAEQRDEALKVARDQLMPLLVNFTAATQSLLPILQNLAAQGWRQRRRDDE